MMSYTRNFGMFSQMIAILISNHFVRLKRNAISLKMYQWAELRYID